MVEKLSEHLLTEHPLMDTGMMILELERDFRESRTHDERDMMWRRVMRSVVETNRTFQKSRKQRQLKITHKVQKTGQAQDRSQQMKWREISQLGPNHQRS